MRAHYNNTVSRQTFILILAGAFTANAQTLVGSLGAMGIAGTLQSINSTAAINGLNAANGLTGINAQQNAAVNQALNGSPPQGSNTGNVTASVTINGVTQALNGTPPQGPAATSPVMPATGGGAGAGVVPPQVQPVNPTPLPVSLPAPGNHHPMLAGNIRVLTVPVQGDFSNGRQRGGILRMVGGFGGFRLSPRFGRPAPASRAVVNSAISTSSVRTQSSSVSISSLRVNPSRTYRRNVRMGFRLK